MKKLLKLLATLSLGSVAVNSVVACSITPNAKKDLPDEHSFVLDLSDSDYDQVKAKHYKVLLNPISDHLKKDGINVDEITFDESNIHEKGQNYTVDIAVKKDSKVYNPREESIDFSIHQSYELKNLITETNLENVKISNEEENNKVKAIWAKIESLNANIKKYDLLPNIKMTFNEEHGVINKATISLKDTYHGEIFGQVDVTLKGKFENKVYLEDVITTTVLPNDVIIPDSGFIVNAIWDKIENWNPEIKKYNLQDTDITMGYSEENGFINNASVWLKDEYKGEVTGQVDIILQGKFSNRTYLQDLIKDTNLGDIKFTNEKEIDKEKEVLTKIEEKNSNLKNYIEKHSDLSEHIKIALDEEDGIVVKARVFLDDEYKGEIYGHQVYVDLKGELSGKTYLQDIITNTDLGKFDIRDTAKARFDDIWAKIVEKNPNIEKLDIMKTIIIYHWSKSTDPNCIIKAKIVLNNEYKGDLTGAVNFTLEGTLIKDKTN